MGEAEEMEEGEPEISQDKINDKDHGIIRRDDGKKMAYQNLEIFSSNSSEDTGICLSIVVNGVPYAGKLHASLKPTSENNDHNEKSEENLKNSSPLTRKRKQSQISSAL